MASEGKIEIESKINAKLDQVWEYWTKPEHITKWNKASEDWLCPNAENDLKEGGKFKYRMESEDGKVGFDFAGTYKVVKEKEKLTYELEDGRNAEVTFSEEDGSVMIKETLDTEDENPVDQQEQGWKSILESFKTYTEEQS
ncbi:SRPBCC domain-containing protein [uncultured Christiangramia sp.]|uniref:SRPBCC domain-containing protein n=1 Tax=uncultured Christiangramia sp. TaxID=503836 RepID=UPI00261E654B|nr:SRPBCC domain-containing protein [uncultured Christiangramia sp.]|tara:strand:- start:26 stop:448 length:423 start_codon:yes stop_codon:yes gene_type:complete